MTRADQKKILRALRAQRTKVQKEMALLQVRQSCVAINGIALLQRESDRLAAEIDRIASDPTPTTF